jgi:hypothetical protein
VADFLLPPKNMSSSLTLYTPSKLVKMSRPFEMIKNLFPLILKTRFQSLRRKHFLAVGHVARLYVVLANRLRARGLLAPIFLI